MPVVWSRISDLFGQIGDYLGCSARFLQLRRREVNQSTGTTVSVNKAALAELNLLKQAPGSSLVDRGGGRRRKGASTGLAVLWPAVVAGGEGEPQYVANRHLLGGAEDPCDIQGRRCSCSLTPHLQGDAEAAPANPQARLHRHLLCSPLRARGSSSVMDGESVSMERCCRASGSWLGWSWRSRTNDSWSFYSASRQRTLIHVAKMVCLIPVCSSEFLASIGRPSFSSGAECFARPEASGLVPVFVHSCSVLNSLLRSGEEEGLHCNLKSFSKVLSTNTRDSYVLSLFLGILCTKLVPPLLL